MGKSLKPSQPRTVFLDRFVGALFLVLTVGFVWLLLANYSFQDWAFARHHNTLSWYIRPLMIIPIMVFAFRRSWAGVSGSVFALFTSMVWFPEPAASDRLVNEFLAYEVDFLRGSWTLNKIGFCLLVLSFFGLLIAAAWKHNWKLLVATLAGAAGLKIIFSIIDSGPAGTSIVVPALAGLVVCIGAVWLLLRRHRSRHK